MPDLFDNIIEWLMDQSLSNDPFEVTLEGLAERLLDGGVPLARISVGRSILHPVIGLIGLQWDRDSGQVNVEHVSRSSVATATPKAPFPKAPFADLQEGKDDVIEADLTKPAEVARYSIFADLAENGITGYIALARRFGMNDMHFSGGFHRFSGCNGLF